LRDRLKNSTLFHKEYGKDGCWSNFARQCEDKPEHLFVTIENKHYVIDPMGKGGGKQTIKVNGKEVQCDTLGLVVDGVAYRSPEHFFQKAKHMKKYNGFQDTVGTEVIDNAPTSLKALEEAGSGGSLKLDRKALDGWKDQGCYQAMIDLKRAQLVHQPYQDALRSTGGKELIENTSNVRHYEAIWGAGCHGEGTNALGKITMLSRHELEHGVKFDMKDPAIQSWLKKPWIEDLDNPIPKFDSFGKVEAKSSGTASQAYVSPAISHTAPPSPTPGKPTTGDAASKASAKSKENSGFSISQALNPVLQVGAVGLAVGIPGYYLLNHAAKAKQESAHPNLDYSQNYASS
jgi:predicted NAD-dependent protein-ADP-ribosyltransferase YbiA (DUF1768 family)